MRVAVLALQGAFIEHEQCLRQLGAEVFEVRQLADWQQEKDALVIPGGESTTQTKLLHDLRLLVPLREAIQQGLPVFGTCAGLILLATEVVDEQRGRLATMTMTVCRNAYGRQLGSFHTIAPLRGIGDDIPMTFIRAPYIKEVYGTTQVLATVEGRIVAAQQGRQLATAFHPELDGDLRLHDYFLRLAQQQ